MWSRCPCVNAIACRSRSLSRTKLTQLRRPFARIDADRLPRLLARHDPRILLKRSSGQMFRSTFSRDNCSSRSKTSPIRSRKMKRIASRYVSASGLPVKHGVSWSVEIQIAESTASSIQRSISSSVPSGLCLMIDSRSSRMPSTMRPNSASRDRGHTSSSYISNVNASSLRHRRLFGHVRSRSRHRAENRRRCRPRPPALSQTHTSADRVPCRVPRGRM